MAGKLTEQAVAQLMQITGQTDEILCRSILEVAGGDVALAMTMFKDSVQAEMQYGEINVRVQFEDNTSEYKVKPDTTTAELMLIIENDTNIVVREQMLVEESRQMEPQPTDKMIDFIRPDGSVRLHLLTPNSSA